jgi:hypothetical protein
MSTSIFVYHHALNAACEQRLRFWVSQPDIGCGPVIAAAVQTLNTKAMMEVTRKIILRKSNADE